MSQVLIFLKWAQWLRRDVLAGRDVVLVNLDETPLIHQMVPRRGYVVRHVPGNRAWVARLGLSARRFSSTLLATVAFPAELQGHMPQFLLTKDKRLLAAEKGVLQHLPSPLRWVQGTDGWVTQSSLNKVLTEIRRAVHARRPGAEIVVVMDCAPVHVGRAVLAHMARLNLHLLLIPSGTTWLLQPLDSHVFATFKQQLHNRQQRERAAAADGVLPRAAWIGIVRDTVRQVLCEKTWENAFAGNGLLASLDTLRVRIRQVLPDDVHIGPEAPSNEDLVLLTGQEGAVLRARCLSTSLRRRAAPPRAAVPAPPLVAVRLAPLPPAPAAGEEALPMPAAAAASSSGPVLFAPPRRTRSGALY